MGGRQTGHHAGLYHIGKVSTVGLTVCIPFRVVVHTLLICVLGPREDAAVASFLLSSGSQCLG